MKRLSLRLGIAFMFLSFLMLSNGVLAKGKSKTNRNSPKIVWKKIFGGKKDFGGDFAIAPTKDGSFIVVGDTWSKGNGFYDIWAIKINKNGKKIWEKTFGGKDAYFVSTITATKDGGFIIVGSHSGFNDIVIIKINKNGKKIWERTFGGKNWDEAKAITPTKDGGFIVVGLTESTGNNKPAAWVMKINKKGKKVWEKTFGGSNFNEATAITSTRDGSFIIVGNTLSYSNSNVWIIKINKNGKKIWKRTFSKSDLDKAIAITPTKDGGFIIVGNIYDENTRIIKIDKNGKKIWKKTFGGKNIYRATAITPTKDGGFIIVGETDYIEDNWFDAWIIKIDKKGKKIWEKTFGGKNFDRATAVTQIKDGGFIVCGAIGGLKPMGPFDAFILKIKE